MDTVNVFLAVGTQWNIIAGLGGVVATGLNYAGVVAAMAAMGIKEQDQPRIFEGVRVMEAETILIRNGKAR